jgi:hypothetical protein
VAGKQDDGSGGSGSLRRVLDNGAYSLAPTEAELPRSPRRQASRIRRLASAGDLNPAWQRWTVDELLEGRARVLVSLARHALESTAAEAYELALDAADQRRRLRASVVTAENSGPRELWGPELAAYVNSRTLDRFLQRRTDTPALPDARPLREGDVFWIVQPVDAAVLSPAALLRGASGQAQVWDVTAAARQASKRSLDEAVRASASTTPDG